MQPGRFLQALDTAAGGQANASPDAKQIQRCVDRRVATFRKVEGPDRPINADVLDEWETECRSGKSDGRFRACRMLMRARLRRAASLGAGALLLALAWLNPCRAELRAVLVGVSEYPTLSSAYQLQGPRNDVESLQRLLVRRGVAERDIALLADGVPGAALPTRANILAALDELARVAGRGDQVLIYFAGHGSQQPVDRSTPEGREEPDGLAEIFLPRDVGRWDASIEPHAVAGAITDFELRRRIDRIGARGAFVWGVFDACHSATLVRAVDDSVRYRQVRPADLGVPSSRPGVQPARQGPRAEATNRHPMPASSGGTAFFYAAQSRELAPELKLPPGAPDRVVHGLFSFALTRALDRGGATTYRQIAQHILAQYAAMDETHATPEFTGSELDAPVLGAAGMPVRQWEIRLVEDGRGARWGIEAGALSGIAEGELLGVYVSPSADAANAVGYARIMRVEPGYAELVPVAHHVLAAPELRAVRVGWYARALQAGIRFGLRVAVDESECGTPCRWRGILADVKAKGVPGAALEWVESGAGADLLLQLLPAKLALISPSAPAALPTCVKSGSAACDEARPLLQVSAQATAAANRVEIERWLHSAARAINLMRLGSTAAQQSVGDDLTVSVSMRRQGELPRAITAESVPVLRPGDRLSITLGNAGSAPLDVTALYVDSMFGINALFPNNSGPSNRLEAGAQHSFDVELIDGTPGIERLVVISVRPRRLGERADFRFLAQPPLTAPRAALFEEVEDVLAFRGATFVTDKPGREFPPRPLNSTSMRLFNFRVLGSESRQ